MNTVLKIVRVLDIAWGGGGHSFAEDALFT
jgi:hypothetical protein